jgi:hypothetical protein
MAERLVPLLDTQVARVRFLVLARPTFRVGKVALFCNPASGGTFSSTAIEIIKWVKKIAVAQVVIQRQRCRPNIRPTIVGQVSADNNKSETCRQRQKSYLVTFNFCAIKIFLF